MRRATGSRWFGFCGWVAYAWFSRSQRTRRGSLIATTIIVIGGLFALSGSTNKAADFVIDIPFAVRTSVLMFDVKTMLMIGIFAHPFLRFSSSMQQYTFVALVIGSMPNARDFELGKFHRDGGAHLVQPLLPL